MIYLAPIQGFTDYIFRQVFDQHFLYVDKYFIPYISIDHNTISSKHKKETNPENNQQNYVVPQVLFSNTNELIILLKYLEPFKYPEINLNMGCPYPMATNRGRGSAWLTKPESIQNIIRSCQNTTSSKISVKIRAGLVEDSDIFKVINQLNEFDLEEIIFHPRTAKQLYKGKVNQELFAKILYESKNRLSFNGDILSVDDFNSIQNKYPSVINWMIGRGLLKNPFLAEEINGIIISEDKKRTRLLNFHDELFENYNKKLSGAGHLLTKMKQFWTYFSFSFSNQRKALKLIKKSKTVEVYLTNVNEILR